MDVEGVNVAVSLCRACNVDWVRPITSLFILANKQTKTKQTNGILVQLYGFYHAYLAGFALISSILETIDW